MRRALLIAPALACVVACGPTPPPPSHVSVAVSPTASSSPEPAPAQRHVPVRLALPTIQVNAAVESLGATQDASRSGLVMAVPSDPADVGWYSPGAAPGDAAGDIVFDGHLDWTSGPAVFWHLQQLKVGDPVTVGTDDGADYNYRVSAVQDVPWDAKPPGLFAKDGPSAVTLITCTGRFNGQRYLQRHIVTAVPA